MSDPPPQKPRRTRDDALAVIHRLRSAGHEAYFAGGCVRDALLGLEPKDYDVATDAPPVKVRQLFPRTQAVGAAFGVILVRHGRSQIEVATFRTDLKYVDGRRPEGVVFTNAQEDAKRRDFTINGLFFDPIDEKVIDFVGGQQDIQDRVLRAIGDPKGRFREDYLRMLRAVRFAARFNLRIDPATREAIRENWTLLKSISPERVADELRLIMTPASRAAAWPLLKEFHFLTVVFERQNDRLADHQDDRSTDAIFLETAPGRTIPFGLALAAANLAHFWPGGGGNDLREWVTRTQIGRTVAELRHSLRISNEEAASVEGILSDVGELLADAFPSVARMKRFLARPTAGQTRELLSAISKAELFSERIVELETRLTALSRENFAPAPFITGDDLTAAGLTPGKIFKLALDEAYDAQLEGRVTDKAQALKLALQTARDAGS